MTEHTKEPTIQRVLESITRQCAAPSGEKDYANNPIPRGYAFIHGRYLNHLHKLFERGLIDYGPAHVGYRATLKSGGAL